MSELTEKLKESITAFEMFGETKMALGVKYAYDFVKEYELEHQPQLNENQQAVLEWLKAYGDKDSGDKPFQTVSYMIDCRRTMSLDYDVSVSLRKFDRKQQAQVLQVFSAWVQEQEGEG